MKVVLDANIFVSFLLTRGMTITTIINSWKEDSYQLLVSPEILAEFNDIFDRLIRRKLINPLTSVVLLNRINYQAVHVDVTSIVALSPDKKDNRYLACAKDGHADYLVSGDQHLLQIRKYRQTKIVSPSEFIHLLRAKIHLSPRYNNTASRSGILVKPDLSLVSIFGMPLSIKVAAKNRSK